jgi:hypothetical protein
MKTLTENIASNAIFFLAQAPSRNLSHGSHVLRHILRAAIRTNGKRMYFPKANPVGLINQILDSQRTILCLHMEAHLFLPSSFSIWVWNGIYIGKTHRGNVVKEKNFLPSTYKHRYMVEMFRNHNRISNSVSPRRKTNKKRKKNKKKKDGKVPANNKLKWRSKKTCERKWWIKDQRIHSNIQYTNTLLHVSAR